MTTQTEAREAIYQAFVDTWDDGMSPVSPYTFDNEDFQQPASGSWVRLAVRHRFSTQSTLGRVGNRKYSRGGSAFVQIFTGIDSGVRDADTLATTARQIFEGVSLSGTTVRFLDVIVREVGPQGKWFLTVVEATFEYEEVR